MTAEELIKNIDWSELRNQKNTLLHIINDGFLPDEEPKDDLNGIIHLIDQLQDYAVDELNIDSIHVFDFETEEGKNDGDFKLDDKATPVKYLKELEFSTEGKILLMGIINMHGSGQHPHCDEQSFDYFYVSYVKDIINENNDIITKKLNDVGNVIFTSIKKSLEIV